MTYQKRFLFYLEFLFAFTKRELQVRYKHTVFGFLWILLNPLIQMAVIGVVVSFVFSPPVPNYFVFLFSGLLPWNFFALTLDKATASLYWNRDLLKKARFPREAIPLSIVFSHAFHFFVALVLFLLFVILKTGTVPSTILFLPIAVVWEIVFLVGLILITSSLEVYYRDVAFFVKALLIVWFYITPILYPLSLVPKRFLTFLGFNPLSPIFSLYHYSLFSASTLDLTLVKTGILITVVLFLGGVLLFRKTSPYFIDWL